MHRILNLTTLTKVYGTSHPIIHDLRQAWKRCECNCLAGWQIHHWGIRHLNRTYPKLQAVRCSGSHRRLNEESVWLDLSFLQAWHTRSSSRKSCPHWVHSKDSDDLADLDLLFLRQRIQLQSTLRPLFLLVLHGDLDTYTVLAWRHIAHRLRLQRCASHLWRVQIKPDYTASADRLRKCLRNWPAWWTDFHLDLPFLWCNRVGLVSRRNQWLSPFSLVSLDLECNQPFFDQHIPR